MDAQLAEFPMMDGSADLTAQTPPAAQDIAAEDALRRARAGENDGFRFLLRLHQARIFSIALRFTGRRAEAEELAQDVFVQLHSALAQIESSSHLTHWLLRTISHRCIDRQRREQRRPRLVSIESIGDVGDLASQEGEGGDPLAGPRLRRLLLDLAPDARAVMVLRYQEDLDPADIATALEMSVNTVKSHLRRSLEWLRAQYAGENHGY
jgi:RNA polymerase sigma-70 factor (ECF subfamily)